MAISDNEQFTRQMAGTGLIETGNLTRSVVPNLSVPSQLQIPTQVGPAIEAAQLKEFISKGLPTDDEIKNQAYKDDNVIDIDQQAYRMTITFNNSQQPAYELNPNAITQLCIEDDLLSWPLRGYIVVNNSQEGFERSFINLFYHIRSDGRDELQIKIEPIVEGKPLDPKIWTINMTACIYDVEDIPTVNRALKMKKLYFWDKRFQFLQEKNIQWSTATGRRFHSQPPPEPIAQASDFERGMTTGEAVASLLAEAGYESYIDQAKWDWGCATINYTAKAEWSIWENIQYLLERHISEQQDDICILIWNRGDEKWNLVPFYTLYEKAGKGSPGELQREHLFFEDYITGERDEKPGNASPWKAPWAEGPQYETDIKAKNFSTILTYRFAQSSGMDNSHAILTRPIYSHWHKQKQFDVEAKENEIKYVREDHIKPKYVDKLLWATNYPVVILNKTKTEEKATAPQFSPVSTMSHDDNDRKIRSLEGKGKILYASIFLNQCMTVRLQGSTHRQAGTFVGVDRTHEESDNSYDYQLCGQYLATNVRHIFQQQKYVNDVVMVKIHAYDSLNDNESIE